MPLKVLLMISNVYPPLEIEVELFWNDMEPPSVIHFEKLSKMANVVSRFPRVIIICSNLTRRTASSLVIGNIVPPGFEVRDCNRTFR